MANEQHDIYLKRDKKLFWNYAQAQTHTYYHTVTLAYMLVQNILMLHGKFNI